MARSDVDDILPTMIARQTRQLQDRPLITLYDDVTGARTELSYATADNWASKTANLLVEEFAVGPGATVALDLAGHWCTVAVALACWKIGAAVRCGAGGAAPALVCCHETRIDAHPDGPVAVIGDGLRAEPVGQVPLRDGLVLLGEEVHAFADDYEDAAVNAAAPAVATPTVVFDHAEMMARAAAWRDKLGARVRVALAAPVDHAAALALLAGAMLAGGSVVGARPAPAAPQWERWTAERVTAVVGVADTIAGAPDGITAFTLEPLTRQS